jgi:hypothetical protein
MVEGKKVHGIKDTQIADPARYLHVTIKCYYENDERQDWIIGENWTSDIHSLEISITRKDKDHSHASEIEGVSRPISINLAIHRT